MYLSEKITCSNCKNQMICVIRKEVQTAIDKGNQLRVLAVYEGESKILSYRIMYALASSCKMYEERTYEED